jgi:SAM-dependent methyltransferase
MNPDEVAAHWEANAEVWTRHSRAGYDVYRDFLNTPAFLAMLPPVRGLTGLDIGCGEGTNTRRVAELGAAMHGVDIAPTFIRHAREAEAADPRGIVFTVGDAMALPYADATFDFATAFMSLMDVPDQGRVLAEAARVLRPGGFLQFSLLHPCFAPPHRKVLRGPDGRTRAIEVGGYFDSTAGRVDTFWFSPVPAEERARVAPFRIPRFHRTLGEWIGFVRAAGLHVEELREPRATPEQQAAQPVVEDTRVAPLFLHLRVTKPAAKG